jgi:WhiB family transcriptional regulator, redox-sensing transcriptional regulator
MSTGALDVDDCCISATRRSQKVLHSVPPDVVRDTDPAARRYGDLPCRREDPELWFGPHPAQVAQAKALCAACPVREACLLGALERREAAGVWGGELLENGAIIAVKRPRGRPRKNAA